MMQLRTGSAKPCQSRQEKKIPKMHGKRAVWQRRLGRANRSLACMGWGLGVLWGTSGCPKGADPAWGGDVKPPAAPAITHTLIQDEPYYTESPAQARPPDGTFKAGTKVTLIRSTGSYSEVRAENGVQGYVRTDQLKPH
jgi:hypothetical protein